MTRITRRRLLVRDVDTGLPVSVAVSLSLAVCLSIIGGAHLIHALVLTFGTAVGWW